MMKSGCSGEQSPRDRGWTPTARGQHLARPSTPARPPPAPPVWTWHRPLSVGEPPEGDAVAQGPWMSPQASSPQSRHV